MRVRLRAIFDSAQHIRPIDAGIRRDVDLRLVEAMETDRERVHQGRAEQVRLIDAENLPAYRRSAAIKRSLQRIGHAAVVADIGRVGVGSLPRIIRVPRPGDAQPVFAAEDVVEPESERV